MQSIHIFTLFVTICSMQLAGAFPTPTDDPVQGSENEIAEKTKLPEDAFSSDGKDGDKMLDDISEHKEVLTKPGATTTAMPLEDDTAPVTASSRASNTGDDVIIQPEMDVGVTTTVETVTTPAVDDEEKKIETVTTPDPMPQTTQEPDQVTQLDSVDDIINADVAMTTTTDTSPATTEVLTTIMTNPENGAAVEPEEQHVPTTTTIESPSTASIEDTLDYNQKPENTSMPNMSILSLPESTQEEPYHSINSTAKPIAIIENYDVTTETQPLIQAVKQQSSQVEMTTTTDIPQDQTTIIDNSSSFSFEDTTQRDENVIGVSEAINDVTEISTNPVPSNFTLSPGAADEMEDINTTPVNTGTNETIVLEINELPDNDTTPESTLETPTLSPNVDFTTTTTTTTTTNLNNQTDSGLNLPEPHVNVTKMPVDNIVVAVKRQEEAENDVKYSASENAAPEVLDAAKPDTEVVEEVNITVDAVLSNSTERIPTLEELESEDKEDDEDGSGEVEGQEEDTTGIHDYITRITRITSVIERDKHKGGSKHHHHNKHHDDHNKHHTGATHHDSPEDRENKKRTAIIVGVAVGGVALFTLAFFTSRHCKKNSREYGTKKQPTQDTIEFVPLASSHPSIYDDMQARNPNGLYRQGPKMGPPSPRMHRKNEGKFEFPEVHKDNPRLEVPKQSQPQKLSEDPFLSKQVDKIKYMDESTDDELDSSPRDRLLPSNDQSVADSSNSSSTTANKHAVAPDVTNKTPSESNGLGSRNEPVV